MNSHNSDIAERMGENLVIIAVVSLLFQVRCQDFEGSHLDNQEDKSCPPWFIYNATSDRCHCGDDLKGIVSCNDKSGDEKIAVMDCFCMTPSENHGTVVGACFYNCEHSSTVFSRDILYHSMPLNSSELDKAMCEKRFNRAGRLCGRCKHGYFPSAYSYDLKCRKCPPEDIPGNWARYFIISFIPLTVFYLVVLVFRISATSPRLLAYVFVAQCLSSPINVRLTLLALEHQPVCLYIAKAVLGLYEIWNLDFFRTLYPPFCLNLTTLQVLALDYLVAVYPLLLVVLTYILIQLHARGCIIVVFLWMPFQKLYSKYQRQFGLNSSIVDIFASFLVFSSNRFLITTLDLLSPTSVYDVNGTDLGLYLYYDATYEYFGREHRPYGVLGILTGTIFVLLPTILLLLYPVRRTQKLWGNWSTLRFFVESFQGCYKDGIVEGKYDLRYFSAFYLILRFVLFLIYAITPNSLFFPSMTVVIAILIMVSAALQPFKKKYAIYGKIELVLLTLFLIWFALCTLRLLAAIKQPQYVFGILILVAVVGSLPLLYLPLLIIGAMWKWGPLHSYSRSSKTALSRLMKRIRFRSLSVLSRKSLDEMAGLLDRQAEREHQAEKAPNEVNTNDQEEERKQNLVNISVDYSLI